MAFRVHQVFKGETKWITSPNNELIYYLVESFVSIIINWFSGVFGGYEIGTMVKNGLIVTYLFIHLLRTQNVLKNYYFLLPDMHMYVSGGKKYCFFVIFCVRTNWMIPIWWFKEYWIKFIKEYKSESFWELSMKDF